MLDQNTDRMWYVIGAVIIGAAIILLLNKTFPQLFASVGETFNDKTEQTTEIVDGIMPKSRMLTPDNLQLRFAKLVDYNVKNNVWTLDLDVRPLTNIFNTGFETKPLVVEIPYGSTYTITYDVKSPVDIMAVPDINARPMSGDQWSPHDNDDLSSRRYNGKKAVEGVDYDEGYSPYASIPVQANTWTTVTFSYSNTASENTNKVAVYDYSDLGVNNITGNVLQIQMRNIRTSISK